MSHGEPPPASNVEPRVGRSNWKPRRTSNSSSATCRFLSMVGARHEAPAPIEEAEPPATCRSCKTAEAVTANEGCGLRFTPHHIGAAKNPIARANSMKPPNA
jgi:hypothetical protein